MYSVRFYLPNNVIKDGVLGQITNSLKNNGKFVENPNGEGYYEVKVEQHLLTHLEEFIPFEFQQKIKKVTSKVTMVTENYGRFGISGGDTRIPVKIGSSLISYEQNKVMIVGTNIQLIVKAYLLFCKHNGVMPTYKKISLTQKLEETQQKLAQTLSELKTLSEKNEKKDKALREIMIATEAKPSILADAFAFIFDKDARVVSEHAYLNGKLMSVREAKKRGLIK